MLFGVKLISSILKFLSAFPFVHAQGIQRVTVIQVLYVLRLGRLLRLLKMGRMLQHIEAGLGICIPHVLVFIILALLLMHVEACLFILIAAIGTDNGIGTWLEGAGK